MTLQDDTVPQKLHSLLFLYLADPATPGGGGAGSALVIQLWKEKQQQKHTRFSLFQGDYSLMNVVNIITLSLCLIQKLQREREEKRREEKRREEKRREEKTLSVWTELSLVSAWCKQGG